ncbi:MAG: DUF5011 domain-containing protein [Bacilli bacterium]|nr:DUF5011 domain-containing protein [Bacilli bacterium]
MVEGGKFNIDSMVKPANKDIVVVFSPSTNTANYTYSVHKDGKVISTVNVKSNKPSNITLDDSGSYQISVVSYDIFGKSTNNNSGIYVIDKEPPVLDIPKEHVTINKGEKFDIHEGVKATDNHDGELTSVIKISDTDLSEAGLHDIIYTVSDEAGNSTSKTVTVNVESINNNLFILQIVIIVLLFLLLFPIFKMRRTFKLEKRIDSFVIESTKGEVVSIFDRMYKVYNRINGAILKIFDKSEFAKKYASKLEKYSNVSVLHNSGAEIFAGKIFVAMLFVVVAVIATTIQFKLISVYEIVVPLLVGFFVLDILYFVKYKAYRMRLENDLLSAIIVMNNAFKSGRSITQAIDIASEEVEGEVGKEFKKMSLELSYGLGIDVVFKRFAERINLEEVNYLTASLTILSKTGGNITKVFDAIEKTMFSKKKLRLELKSLTGSSKIIVYVLFAVPFIFVLFISIINPSYFMPFVTTKLGAILLIGLIIYYIIFIICVRRIMKVVI